MKLLNFFIKRTFTSPYNGEIKMGFSYGHKTLFAGGIPQSGGEFVYMWDKVLKENIIGNIEIKNCLVLGVAGGTVIKLLRKYFPAAKITGVDIDTEMIRIITAEYGMKENENLRYIVADACNWVAKKRNARYDLIIVDLYIGDLNPPCCRQKKFLVHLKRLLIKEGHIIFNCHYQMDKSKEYSKILDLCQNVFTRVKEVFSYPKNKILLGSR